MEQVEGTDRSPTVSFHQIFIQFSISNVLRNSAISNTPNKRLKGAGRPLKNSELDEKVINWVRMQRQKKLRVSRKMIQKQALVFSTDEEFKVGIFKLLSYFSMFRRATDGFKNSWLVIIWVCAARRPPVKRNRKSSRKRLSTISSSSSSNVVLFNLSFSSKSINMLSEILTNQSKICGLVSNWGLSLIVAYLAGVIEK